VARKNGASKKKAKVRGTFVEHVRRDKLLERYEGNCGICRLPVNPKTFEVDHIFPAHHGGTHSYENCQPAHPACNRLKGNLKPDDLVYLELRAALMRGERPKRIKSRYVNKSNAGIRPLARGVPRRRGLLPD
jgi:5-methylcytosine-specific restriction endonuclease McrA